MAAEIVNEISEFLQKGRAKNVKKLVQDALDQGVDPKEILNEGLLAGMMIVGGKFKRNEVFVPEVLVAARAMSAGIAILEPKLIEVGNEPIGKAVVDADTFIAKAEEVGADVIGMSALLTTTMPNMKDVVDALNERGLREKYIVMVGGAPVNETFAEQIGADFYTADAPSAAEVAKEEVLKRKAS